VIFELYVELDPRIAEKDNTPAGTSRRVAWLPGFMRGGYSMSKPVRYAVYANKRKDTLGLLRFLFLLGQFQLPWHLCGCIVVFRLGDIVVVSSNAEIDVR
jgi:hypothetical protein